MIKQYAYVIKRNDGQYLNLWHNDDLTWYEQLYNASCEYSKKRAENVITDYELENCSVVKIEISEVQND